MTDPTKINAIQCWTISTTVKQLRGFLGLTGYNRHLIQHYDKLARPLTDLLRKDNFQWSDTTQEVFNRLRTTLLTTPVLALAYPSKTFVVETDASFSVIGVVLMQDHHLIAFISKVFSSCQQALSVYEKELLAILFAVKKWHYYLITGHFVIRTDQRSLKHLLEQKVTIPLQHTWLSKLMRYDYEIVYKKGKENVIVDALSRVQGFEFFELLVSSIELILLTRIQGGWTRDAAVQATIRSLQSGEEMPSFVWSGTILTRKGKLVVGNDLNLRHDLLLLCHASSMGRGILRCILLCKGCDECFIKGDGGICLTFY